MSSNGVMLQDYVPNAINNLTEEIWCAGAVIPAGKRVVIGHNRDGWQEITFTMGPMEDFIGMAMVPPSVVGIEEPRRIPGVGFMPQGVAAMRSRRNGAGAQVSHSWQLPNCPPGYVVAVLIGQKTQVLYSDWINWPDSQSGSPGWHVKNNVTAFFRCIPANYPQPSPVPVSSYRSPAIDQNAPKSSVNAPVRMMPGIMQAQSAHQALVSSGGPSNKMVDDFRDSTGGNCPPGQAVFGKYGDGRVVQFDADWYNVLRNNPSMRTGLVSLFCDWPHGQAEAPISPRGGFQHQPPLTSTRDFIDVVKQSMTDRQSAAPPAQTASQAYTSALRQQALPANQSQAPRSSGGGYQVSRIGVHGHDGVGDVPEELPEGWPESASPGTGIFPYYSPAATREIAIPPYAPATRMMPGIMRGAASVRAGVRGLGAGGASAFTMTAANALNQELITNNCAGCADMTSRLRQLTFAFKAAVSTDQGLPSQNLNMSNMLAMTAYGPATDAALKLVLGSGTAYTNGPCTDDAGNCLGNIPTPITPQTVQTVEQQFAAQIQAALKQVAYVPQADIVHTLVQGFSTLVTQFATELAKVKYNLPNLSQPATPPPATTTASTGVPWGTIAVAGLVGTTILATGALIYTHARRA